MDVAAVPSPIIFIAMWLAVSFLLSYIGGWARLAQRFPCRDGYVGSWKSWQSGKIGVVNYNSCLWVAAAPEGLYIRTGPLFLYRAFHAPLLVPWTAIRSVEERKYWWRRF